MRVSECACCGVVGRLDERGLLAGCRDRAAREGRLGDYPTERELADEDLLFLIEDLRLSHAAAAERLRVTKRAVTRRLAALRRQVMT